MIHTPILGIASPFVFLLRLVAHRYVPAILLSVLHVAQPIVFTLLIVPHVTHLLSVPLTAHLHPVPPVAHLPPVPLVAHLPLVPHAVPFLLTPHAAHLPFRPLAAHLFPSLLRAIWILFLFLGVSPFFFFYPLRPYRSLQRTNISCKGSVDTTINGVDTMVQNKGRNVKKISSSVDTSPGQVDTRDRFQRNKTTDSHLRSTRNQIVDTTSSQVDTRDLSQGFDLPVWDSVSTHLMGRSTHSGISVT
ncbi:hypothetical protein Taro_033159 [Colocasia esculenta]|uniref:Uncharacterized protein n=1 Tax=Colocasia esculenta TaxID=4460 RepID=A0A843W879_COLES|nr:hypothetical protein [Colocasia esculenta]